jgi:hypothetical protein
MVADQLEPVLAADDEMPRKVGQSTVCLGNLVAGRVRAEHIERAFSASGCGAVLIALDGCMSSYRRSE